ncbi:unnamed protein product [Lactuca virosa]|uniref:Uncharacterized protein n=1 Tax=Lactuca virosa TaxID=75947 RepID=A0AAU9N2U8_9ASTR|nr:unnamed protein product [Lactuca virosa]
MATSREYLYLHQPSDRKRPSDTALETDSVFFGCCEELVFVPTAHRHIVLPFEEPVKVCIFFIPQATVRLNASMTYLPLVHKIM